MNFEGLTLTDLGDGVWEILLNRPDLLNRFDNLLQIEVAAALRSLDADERVRAIVLGSTGKAFSAGGDFALMYAAHEDEAVRRDIVAAGKELLRAFIELRPPVVVAVQGAAIGLGATVALMCDVVVASRNAKLADTHVALGLVAGDGGCLAWPLAAGMLRAKRYLLTGDALDAATAYAVGIVTDVVEDPGHALPAAREIAARIAAMPPLAVQGTKKALNHILGLRAAEVVDLAFDLEDGTLQSADLLEGIAAFKDGRPAKFTGR